VPSTYCFSEYEEALRAPSQSNSVSAAAASTPATSAASVESPTPPSGDSQPEEGEYALQADVTLEGHEGYVSCVRFLQSGDVVTGSGDASCGLWDAAHGVLKQRFSDHSGDVCHVAVNPEAPTVFASVSLDATAKVWDTRVGGNGRGSTPIPTGGGGGGFGSSLRGGGGSSSNANVSSVSTNSGGGGGGGSSSQPVITFEGHLAEVNACHFLPGGTSLATGSDDATCRVFDLRCRGELRCFHDDAVSSGVSSLTATRSGRIVFGGYDDAFVRGWDLFGFESSSLAAAGNGGGGWGGNGDGSSTCAWTLDGHISRVSCLAASRDGAAVASGSWDGDLRIWA
jgi:guanine nucleotide-binding protein G(I)/G(S)/G(T) subunit beta-1